MEYILRVSRPASGNRIGTATWPYNALVVDLTFHALGDNPDVYLLVVWRKIAFFMISFLHLSLSLKE